MPRRQTLMLLNAAAALLFLCAAASAHPATGIVVDKAGRVYFSDLETVWRLDASGRLSVFRPGRSGEHVHELSIDGQGNVYGANTAYQPSTAKWITSVWRRSPEGVETFLVAPTTDPPPALSIWRQHDGSTYFFDQDNNTRARTVLLKRAPDGTVTTVAGGAYGHADGRGTEARFQSIGGMALVADGSLYVTDGGALRRVFPDGTVRTVASDLSKKLPDDSPAGFGGPSGLAVDARGIAYVADRGNRRVLKVTAEGSVERILRAEPPWAPDGVAVGVDGSVLVLETGFTRPSLYVGPRVRRLAPDGKVSVIASLGEKEKAEGLRASAALRPGERGREDERPAGESSVHSGVGVGVYYGLGLLAICAVAGLRLRKGV